MSLRWTTTDNSSLAQSQFYLLTLTPSFHVSCSPFLSSGQDPTEHGPQSVSVRPPLLFSLHSADREVSLNSKPSSWSFIWNIFHWADMAPKNLARPTPHFIAGERAHTCMCSLTETHSTSVTRSSAKTNEPKTSAAYTNQVPFLPHDNAASICG